jgi:metal-responsive CopG/Arc/MetJ family transcriptional regulator
MMQQITIRMTEKDLNRIEHIAKSAGLKKSDITRMAIRKFVDEYKPEDGTPIYDKVKHLVGVVESGIPDLGLNHRNHMIKKIKKANQ